MTTREQIDALIANPELLLQKPPFWRQIDFDNSYSSETSSISLTGTVTAQLPKLKRVMIPQSQFMKELDPYSHTVMFDENIPCITVKARLGGLLEINQHRMPIPFQVLVRDKQVRHLCVNKMNHTLLNTKPTDKQKNDFIRIKQGWIEKNMEGAKTKFVKTQKSYGDGALLFMMSEDGKLVTKNISFDDGYVIITHKNNMGQHILECLYYSVTDSDNNVTEYIDCYDDKYITRLMNVSTFDSSASRYNNGGWIKLEPVEHGFSENPLITKRGDVAWNRGQKDIESYEAVYNTFIVIQKKYGWGALYVKGKFNDNGRKIANAIVLNDTSLDPNADAKFLDPPAPQNMIETLELMEQTIMKACGTTFILPKDIKISGDTSGLAVEMTQELDMATAQDGVIEWQNVANKMMRLFKEGFAKELVNTGENPNAVTDFMELRIQSEFMVWKPKSEEAHNQMLSTLYANGNGGISRQTYVEKNTISTPDEAERIKKEHEEAIKEQEEMARKEAELTNKNNNASEEVIVSQK